MQFVLSACVYARAVQQHNEDDDARTSKAVRPQLLLLQATPSVYLSLMLRTVHLVQETDVKRTPAAQTSRAEAIALLLSSCRRLLLRPDHGDTRHRLAVVLATAPLTWAESDPLLITALVKEARAHAEELAWRLEAPGYSSLYIAATTARLHQTLTILQRQLAPEIEEADRQRAAA